MALLHFPKITATQHEAPIPQNFKHKLEDGIDVSHAEKLDRVEAPFDLHPTIEKTITRDSDKHMISLLFAVWFVDGIQIRSIVSKFMHYTGSLLLFPAATLGTPAHIGLRPICGLMELNSTVLFLDLLLEDRDCCRQDFELRWWRSLLRTDLSMYHYTG